MVFAIATVLLAAWGALAFGGVYPWAYWPLAAGAVVLGVWGLVAPKPPHQPAVRSMDVLVPIALLLVIGGAITQLLPLPQGALARVSPETHQFLRNYDVAYASGLTPAHPLSIRPDATLTATLLLASLSLLLLGVARMMTLHGLRPFASAIVGLAVVVAVVGIVQRPLYEGRIYGFWEPEVGGTPFGPFINRNHYAGWMMMALSLSLGHFCGRVSRDTHGVAVGARARLVWLGSREASQIVMLGSGVALMALALVLTMSRSGTLCFLAAIALTARFIWRGERRGSKAVLSIYLVVVVLAAIGWTGPDAIVGHFREALEGYAVKRVEPWLDALDIANAFKPFGSGLNTYGFATLFYQKRDLQVHYGAAHNDYLQLAAEGGLLLLIPVALAVAAAIRSVRRRLLEGGEDPLSSWERLGAITGLLAIAIQEMVDFSLQMPGNAVLFTILLAAALHHGLPLPSKRRIKTGDRKATLVAFPH